MLVSLNGFAGRALSNLQSAVGPFGAHEMLVRVKQRHERRHKARMRLCNLGAAWRVALHHYAAATQTPSTVMFF